MRLALVGAALVLAGCSTSQVSRFQGDVSNLAAGVVAVSSAIATIDAKLAQNCAQAENVGAALAELSSGSRRASSALNAINAGITTWCLAPPVDVATAVQATSSMVKSGLSAYRAVKPGG